MSGPSNRSRCSTTPASTPAGGPAPHTGVATGGQSKQQQQQHGCGPSRFPLVAAPQEDVVKVQAVPKSYDDANLPSYKDGITPEEENMKRSRTCRFIEEAGRILRLPRLAVATSMVLFHRFFAKHSFAEHDRFEVAVACILLAAKVEEAPKRLSTIIVECHALKCSGAASSSKAATALGRSPPPGTITTSEGGGGGGIIVPLDTNGEEYIKLKERILLLERVVLHTIAFELSIDHPYKFLVDQVRKWCNLPRKVEYEPNSEGASAVAGAAGTTITKKMTDELVQWAMSFANDSMHTCLCLQYTAKHIALACVFMSAKFCGIRPIDSEGKGWIDLLDNIPVEILVSICEQIMDLISKKQGPNGAAGNRETISTFFRSMQRELDALKKQNFLIAGPTVTVDKSGHDGTIAKRGVEDTSGEANTNQVKRPRL